MTAYEDYQAIVAKQKAEVQPSVTTSRTRTQSTRTTPMSNDKVNINTWEDFRKFALDRYKYDVGSTPDSKKILNVLGYMNQYGREYGLITSSGLRERQTLLDKQQVLLDKISKASVADRQQTLLPELARVRTELQKSWDTWDKTEYNAKLAQSEQARKDMVSASKSGDLAKAKELKAKQQQLVAEAKNIQSFEALKAFGADYVAARAKIGMAAGDLPTINAPEELTAVVPTIIGEPTPDPSDPNYSLVTDPNWHPETAEDLTGQEVDLPDGSKMPLAQWVGLTNAEQEAVRSGVGVVGDMGMVTLDTGEKVLKYDFFKISPEGQQILLTQGIEGYNQWLQNVPIEENVPIVEDDTAVRDYITAVGGNVDYYLSLAEPDQQIYLQQLQDTQSMDIQEYIEKVGGNYDYFKTFAPEDQTIYLQQLGTTQEMDIEEFKSSHVQVGPKENNEWMLNDDYKSLPASIKETIDKIGITGYKAQIAAQEAILAPYQTTVAEEYGLTQEQLNKSLPGIRKYETTPYYDLSKISLEDAQKPEIRAAVAAIFPSLNLDQLGKKPLDKSAYEELRDAHYRGIVGKYNGIPVSDWNKYYPISPLSITDYQSKKQALIDSGLSLNEVNKTMSNYYMSTSSVEEYKEFAKNQGLAVSYQPTTWQQMTPWREETGQTVTLQGGTTMAMDILVPGYFVARNWSDLTGSQKALNITLDVVSLIPFLGAASLGARGVSVAGKGVRAAAIGEAVAREAVSQVKAPVTMLIHPIGTIKAGYRTIADVLEDVFDPRKLGEAVITTSNHTVKIRIGKDVPLVQAMRIRDELATLVSQGERPIVDIIDDAGNGVRIELAQSPLMKEVGGGMVSGTPYGSEWMKQIKEQGYASVAESSEGGRMFFSAEPHPRFAFSTAAGEEGTTPTMMIFGKDNPLIAKLENSGKLYRAPGIGLTAEIEKTAPAGTLIWADVPQQILYTRVGANREIMEIWLDKALTPAQIAKLKAMNLIERIKAPFKAPIKVTQFGQRETRGLTEEELRAIANIIEEGGNAEVAGNLRRFISESDVVRPAVGAMRRNPISLDRYDPFTGEIYRQGELPRELSISRMRLAETAYREGARVSPDRTIPARLSPDRITPARETPARLEALRETPARTEPDRITPDRVVPDRMEPSRTELGRETDRIIPDRFEPDREHPTRYKPDREHPTRYKGEGLKVSELSKQQLEGSVAWRQGWCYKLIYPPYGQENIINSKKSFPGMRIHKDAGSAFKTLLQIVDGTLPPTITRDMGIMDISIDVVDNPSSNVKHKLGMKYKLDRNQQTQTTPKIVRG